MPVPARSTPPHLTYRDLLELRPERGKRDGQGFRVSWFSVERTDSGKTRVFDEDGDEVNADFFECEAYQRIWDAVDLLWLIFDNGEKNDDSNNRCDSLRNQSESSHENPLPPDLAIRLLTAKRSLLWLRESLGDFPRIPLDAVRRGRLHHRRRMVQDHGIRL